jgi:hypothetical protein
MQIIVSWATQTSFAIQISVATEIWKTLKKCDHWQSGFRCCDFIVRGTRQEINEFCSTNELPKLSYVLTHISRIPSHPDCKRSTLTSSQGTQVCMWGGPEKATMTGRYCVVSWRQKHLFRIKKFRQESNNTVYTGKSWIYRAQDVYKNVMISRWNQRQHFWPDPQMQHFSTGRMRPSYGPWEPFGSVGKRVPADYCQMLNLVRRYSKIDGMGRRRDSKIDHSSRVHYFTCRPLASVSR